MSIIGRMMPVSGWRPPQPTGAELIAQERKRQVEQEGWVSEHDDREHRHGELAGAAMCYIANRDVTTTMEPPLGWPWEASSWKPSGPIRNLVKAGALIAAEIDRLQRATPPPTPEER